MMQDRVGEYFTLGEFIFSDTATRLGIANVPPPKVEANIRNVLAPGMGAVRQILGSPVIIRSGYRCPELNAAVRGSPTSDHLTGHAADFVCPLFGSARSVARHLVDHMATLKPDQIIFEGTWVHISFGPRRRNQVLTAHFTPHGVSYTQGIQ